MLDDFLIRAALAGIGLSLAAGMLGCFVVWRRMAYFGDATAHAAILGVALALAFDFSITAGTLVVALGMALSINALASRGQAIDSGLGVLSFSALALGLVAISFVPTVRVDLTSYLFGDILAVGLSDILTIWFGAAAVCGILVWRWSRLLAATLNSELAASAGIDPRREELVLTVSMAVVVALAIKVVGALLIAALLIIPASASRNLSRTPESMAALAVCVAVGSILLGLSGSLRFDTPAGPTIIVAAALLFVASVFARPLLRNPRRRDLGN